MDRGGRIVVAPQYHSALPGTEERAPVAFETKVSFFQRLRGMTSGLSWGYVNGEGIEVVRRALTSAGYFSEGYAPAQAAEGTGWGIIDRAGQWVIPPKFGAAAEFGEGLAPLYVSRTGMWGYMDLNGQFAVLPRYNVATAFHEGVAAVSHGPTAPGVRGIWGYIDTAGHWVIRPVFDLARPFGEGLAPAVPGPRDEVYGARARKWGYVNRAGEWVIPPQFDDAQTMSEGRALVRIGDECFFLDSDGAVVLSLGACDATSFSGGLAAVVRSHALGETLTYVDPQGHEVWQSEPEA